MFNFSTSTIINSLKDVNGLDLITKTSNGAIVKRVGTFKKDDVVSFFKTVAVDEEPPVATVSIASAPTAGNIYRLAINIELNKSESSLYALPYPTKGKPIYVEAIAPDATAASLATTLAKNAKKYMALVYDTEILTITATASTLTLTGTEGIQVLKSVELEMWEEAPETYNGGKWVSVASGAITAGNPGFGTYKYMLHNHRLPTMENIRFGGILEDETPMVGKMYNQYTLRMRSVRDPYGVHAVGGEIVSITEHVFWVESTIATDFETAMASVAAPVTVSTTSATNTEVGTDNKPVVNPSLEDDDEA